MKIHNLKLTLFITFSLILTLLLNTSVANLINKCQGKYVTGVQSIGYRQSLSFGGEANETIGWSFKSSESNIGIIVRLLDEKDYNKSLKKLSYDYIELSNGTKSKDSGSYDVQYLNTWYIMFLNLDSDKNLTIIEYEICFCLEPEMIIEYEIRGYNIFLILCILGVLSLTIIKKWD